jgi:hypothetical protein
MLPDLATFVLLTLATTGLAAFIRALPWHSSWLQKKPLACPVCMTGWAGFVVLGLASFDTEASGWSPATWALLWCAGMGVGAPLFKKLYPPDVELPLP